MQASTFEGCFKMSNEKGSKGSYYNNLILLKVSFMVWTPHIVLWKYIFKGKTLIVSSGYLMNTFQCFLNLIIWIIKISWSPSLQNFFSCYTCWIVYFILLHIQQNENAGIFFFPFFLKVTSTTKLFCHNVAFDV